MEIVIGAFEVFQKTGEITITIIIKIGGELISWLQSLLSLSNASIKM